jgi:uroporphyrin-III C-methyltransferase/precorrin-2 dehydrogenase/sirohydrochlorin ferrochelatase
MNANTADGNAVRVYPLSVRMEGRLAVVVGGGAVAVRRVAGLLAAGAEVLVVAPDLSPSLADLVFQGRVGARQGRYQAADLRGAWLVLACTDQPGVNAAVAADAERMHLWCVRADDATASAAWVPAVGRVAGVTLAVNADRNPRRATALRDDCLQLVRDQSRQPDQTQPDQPGEEYGQVSIVGGGPGDPGLITVAGAERLRRADVVVTDRLVARELIANLPEQAVVIDAGKVPAGPAMRQDDINAALVEHARAGRAVVRLKGGDPFVFGRGREEVDACRAAGVAVEVIPGVTSAVSVPAAAGIPVTHRGLSQGFTVVTGHGSPSEPRNAIDWAALARSGTTLVLLMAVEHITGIADTLMEAGLAAGTPAACVTDGWRDGQRVVTATLGGLAEAMQAEGMANPAVIVIGDTAGYAARDERRAPPSRPQAPLGRPGSLPDRSISRLPGSAAPARSGRRVLVLGGARSGKSATAEEFLASCREVEYVATGAPPGRGDPQWAARVHEHRGRRPANWSTTETLDLEQVLKSDDPAPLLVDCLSAWLTRVMDECEAWTASDAGARAVAARTDRLLLAWRSTARHVVAVSSEVGSGVVPDTLSGRLFRDALGRLNARIAAESDEVWLCTVGLARRLR